MPIEQNTTTHIITNTQILMSSGLSVIVGSLITLCGVFLKSYLDNKESEKSRKFEENENKKKRLFEAKIKAYSGVIGQFEINFSMLYEKYDNFEFLFKKHDEIICLLSDVLLVCNENLKNEIDSYVGEILNVTGFAESNKIVLRQEGEKISKEKSIDLNNQTKERKMYRKHIHDTIKIIEKGEKIIQLLREDLNNY